MPKTRDGVKSYADNGRRAENGGIAMGYMDLIMNLQLFAADGGDGGGGGNPDTGGTGGTQEPDAGGKGGGEETKTITMTQAELDRLMGERAGRAERAALERQAKELGFESAEAMQKAAKAAKEAEEAQKTEAQKLQEQLEAEKAKATQATERAKRALIKAAFAEQAIAANLVSVDDSFVLADLSGVEVDDDGKVTGVKEAVEQLAKDKPYLVKQGGGGAGGSGGNPSRGGPSPDNEAELGRRMAMQRNQAPQTSGGFDPWGQGGGQDQTQDIAETVAAAVAAALKGNQQ